MTGDPLVDDFLERNLDEIALYFAERTAAAQRQTNKLLDDLARSIARSTRRLGAAGEAMEDTKDAIELAWNTIRRTDPSCARQV
jgi:hypothetical protein